jgi:hypothetical protein
MTPFFSQNSISEGIKKNWITEWTENTSKKMAIFR